MAGWGGEAARGSRASTLAPLLLLPLPSKMQVCSIQRRCDDGVGVALGTAKAPRGCWAYTGQSLLCRHAEATVRVRLCMVPVTCILFQVQGGSCACSWTDVVL